MSTCSWLPASLKHRSEQSTLTKGPSNSSGKLSAAAPSAGEYTGACKTLLWGWLGQGPTPKCTSKQSQQSSLSTATMHAVRHTGLLLGCHKYSLTLLHMLQQASNKQ